MLHNLGYWNCDSAVNILRCPTFFSDHDSIASHTSHRPMLSRLKLTFAVILLLPAIVLPAPAAAQSPLLAAEQNPDEWKAIQPSLGISFDFDSNIYDSSTSVESWIGIVKPAILFSTAPAPQRFGLLYQGDYGYFFDESADDYTDHVLSGGAQFQLGSRGQVELAAATEKGHWDRGSYQTEGIDPTSPFFPGEPDEFDRNKWGGKFQYGAEGNRGRLRFGFGGNQLDYTNNRERTRFLDYDVQYGTAGLSLLFHQRTAIVLDAVFADIRYERDRPGEASFESEDWRYLLGVTWEATAKTAGSIRLGTERRRFDDPARGTTSNPSWEVDVRWSPLERSHFDFVTSRENEETFGEGDFIDTTEYRVTWTHQWSPGWESVTSWARSDSEFVESMRDQDSSRFYVGLRYPQGRLLIWEVSFERRSRDSNRSDLVYDGNLFSIGVNIGI